jgi:hypothetical protein
MLTAKSDAKIQKGGVTARREMEIPWTQNALKIVNQKMALGLVLRQPDLESVDDAIEQVRGHGLLMVQQRETERVKRRITNTGTHLPIAQLCLDTVLYHLNNSKVTLREIEIEAEKSADTKDITSIRDALESLYPAKLLRWPYGKFVTGKAIEKLSKLKQLNRLVDSEGLKLEAFEAIDRVIRSRNFQTLQNSN